MYVRTSFVYTLRMYVYCMYVALCSNADVRTYVCMYMQCLHTYVRMYVRILLIRTYTYMCTYVHICVRTYILYTYTNCVITG